MAELEQKSDVRDYDSSLEAVDVVEAAILEAAAGFGFSEDDLPWIGMAIRESMVNAVVHGNRYSSHKKVRVEWHLTPGRLEVTIGDEGEGFELKDVPDPLAEENLLRQSGRGILLIRSFMDEFEVRRRQPQGTEVRMVKFAPK
ncbi:MAG: ATP-binding protein [Acidobacteria bacterium]|nr:ATP-binding protein [Acidobacteriota bacterium]